jgi:very-short-patch-repair endonuclease
MSFKQCIATTIKSQKQCSKRAPVGSEYCTQHTLKFEVEGKIDRKDVEEIEENVLKEDDNRPGKCIATIENGNKCTKNNVEESKYCKQHMKKFDFENYKKMEEKKNKERISSGMTIKEQKTYDKKQKRIKNRNADPEYVKYKDQICPTGQKLCDNNDCKICFYHSFASHPKAKFWSSKNQLNPRQCTRSSGQERIFDCPECKHEITMGLNHIHNGAWCKYCNGGKDVLCDDLQCLHCFNRSFASHEMVKFLSKNNKKDARFITKSSKTELVFTCDKCEHEFEKAATYITNKNEWCPYCSGNGIFCIKEKNCQHCFNRSFASNEYSLQLHPNCKEDPYKLSISSSIILQIICNDCDHIFYQSPHYLTMGHGCPYCVNKALCIDETCQMCFNNSFASISESKYWSELNNIKPRNVFKNTNMIKYKFDCPYCNNIYESDPANITSKGSWCECIRKKSELKLYNYLQTILNNYAIEREKTFSWCKNILVLPFDFFIEELKLIIELDGQQHFEQVGSWKTPKEIQERDIYKQKLANENGYSIIRITVMDVRDNKNDWRNKLKEAIKKYDKVQNILIGEIYDQHSIYKQ